MEEHARSLAIAQPVAPLSARSYQLTERLAENLIALRNAQRVIAQAIEDNRPITPAAEWLIDNFHFVEKQVREIQMDLPKSYYRQLPKLLEGPFIGYPRVFGVAWAFVAHTDSWFDVETLCRYVRAYQGVQPLTIGELWATSITLRIVLIENLRRMADRIAQSYASRQQADDLADKLLTDVKKEENATPFVLADLQSTPFTNAFAVELIHRLRDQDPKVTPILAWLDKKLADDGTSADIIVREEHQNQGAGSVTVRNIITSLRSVSDVDWSVVFERMSFVDDSLRKCGDYSAMDFPTRNLYRSAIEQLARGSHRAETEIARRIHQTVSQFSSTDDDPDLRRKSDAGYHLLTGGRKAFEKAIGFQAPPQAWFGRSGKALGIRGYAFTGLFVASAILVIPLYFIAKKGIAWPGLTFLALIGIIPAIDLAVALVNRMVTRTFGATLLPGLELVDGVPAELRTLIAVPVLLTSRAAIDEQLKGLEVHYLASSEGELHFALVSDWVDANNQTEASDKELFDAVAEGIEGLNQKYGKASAGDRFLLLHRHRVWNESERKWLGWERKRGKLHELNRLLRGAKDTTFVELPGIEQSIPQDVRYVITLDADTRLPRDTVRRLIGKMAHPLNKPRLDHDRRLVVEGYAILQPRVTPSLPVGREGSRFQRIFSSMNGIDPYESAISDVYQDLFGEGSYAGKGIYDIDAFEFALADRVPDSTMLSHDLFEGVFARSGLASDVEVVEEFPARYDVAALRHHRWARGDWQLLPWIFGRGPRSSSYRRSSVPAMGRWKMLDNLRRTFSAPAAVIALFFGWTMPVGSAVVWTAFIVTTVVLPTLLPVATGLFADRRRVTVGSRIRSFFSDLHLAFGQSVLLLVLLAHQAWSMIDAVARTLTRLFVTHRNLLEWTPAAQTAIGPGLNLRGFYRQMEATVVIAMLSLIVAVGLGTDTWPLALPFAILWASSPAFARSVSLSPQIAGRVEMSKETSVVLRLTARRTWRFFETFVTTADNMLPPDNFQEDPAAVAHRTSPTNIGLYLLSTVSARDFGWIGTSEAIERFETTFASMKRLERFRGHLYNWYDTQDLRTLDPPYVSTVDSGNLAGHLIVLARACIEWKEAFSAQSMRGHGISDAVALLRVEAKRVDDGRRGQTATFQQLDLALDKLELTIRRNAENRADPLLVEGLARQAETIVDIAKALSAETNTFDLTDLVFWAGAIRSCIESHRKDFDETESGKIVPRLAALADEARTMALEMDYGFLFDEPRKLLSIGYLAPEGKLDINCYDLLASEARLASFFAIAKGDIPARHWFRLGREPTRVGSGSALISWSGSMFEYLMPSLVMRAPDGSIMERTNNFVVKRQIEYGNASGVPWGVSESAYNARDIELTYQYANFGIPGLGLKRGLAENAVVAPYATALAAMVLPDAAAENLNRLEKIGARGRYGFYEALDYTKTRVPAGESVAMVRAFMAHHQGMTIVAIADALLDGIMRTRFHSDAIIEATELLLQERAPRSMAPEAPRVFEPKPAEKSVGSLAAGGRRLITAHGTTPESHLLSNGRYSIMLTAAGSGYSRWSGIDINRWRQDVTCDDYGSYIFMRDSESGNAWSVGLQPAGVEADDYEVIFDEDRARYTRRDGTLTTVQEILISAEDDAEVRRVSITNAGKAVREIQLTSYSEIVLARQSADIAHPAFSKLFVETEYLSNEGVILATRRKRSPSEPDIWAAHLSVLEGGVGKVEIETDRARFLGRGNGIRTAIAAIDGLPLSGTVGTVLDPVFSIRRTVQVPPGETVTVAFWTMVASSRSDLLDLVDKRREMSAFERASTLAWTQAQVELRHIGISHKDAANFQRLAGHLIFANPALRPGSDTIRRGVKPQSALWSLGISGDLPILMLRISEAEDLDLVRQLLHAHEYWRLKQLAVDLVIINERSSSYVQDLQIAIETLVRATGQEREGAGGSNGRVFVLRSDIIPAEGRALLMSIARVVLVGQRGRLSDQLDRIPEIEATREPSKREPAPSRVGSEESIPGLEFFNGLGGFSKDGKEYVTILNPGQATPAPWINVIANPNFGFQVSTEGCSSTWSVNSRENQLTPWSNDPVTDRSGEVFYLRDNDSGEVWSATALPIRDATTSYVCRHGRGYTHFSHKKDDLDVELVQFVPLNDPIKISRLRIENQSSKARDLSIVSYVEWVLGQSRQTTAPFVITETDADNGAMFATNPWSNDFGSRVAFADMGGRQQSWTADRVEFIGRNGTLSDPKALRGEIAFSKKTGAGLDPCCAMETSLKVAAGESVEIFFLLGQTANTDQARNLIAKYRAADLAAEQILVEQYWKERLEVIQVKTPDRSLDIMLNGWLLYQTLASRVWARSAFYQTSGAYGFRDQLQDGMSLVNSLPSLTREHLLRAAGRQFPEGDVQHWWLPHSGQGVRTRISDDRAWLSYTVAHYIRSTGDIGVLDELIPFLEGPKLVGNEHDSFFLPTISDDVATLFEHCARALDQSLVVGAHGLPLMGTGDWNDGMNRVGEGGQGESVWLGWLLYTALKTMAGFAEARGEQQRAGAWRKHADDLQTALEREAWDGDWYRRGWFDDGTPFGSVSSEECKIDSIAQSWAVLSRAADPTRASHAMASVERELIKPDVGLALLFKPPFNKTPLEPGYIKGYPPGIRENGGQYTHAATWSVMALAQLGEGGKATDLFSLLNPINHASNRADAHRYKVEPYVVAADVYAVAPHTGRGGWTWYTGSAGWLYRAGLESILGIRIEAKVLYVEPAISSSWPGFSAAVRFGTSVYNIEVVNTGSKTNTIKLAKIDEKILSDYPIRIPLVDDGLTHVLNIELD